MTHDDTCLESNKVIIIITNSRTWPCLVLVCVSSSLLRLKLSPHATQGKDTAPGPASPPAPAEVSCARKWSFS